jgi:transcriptional regulator with XRE-family HTH domain
MTHEEIIETIRNHRKSLGITIVELSERVNIRATTICDIENGKRNPSLTTLLKITDALGIKIEILAFS